MSAVADLPPWEYPEEWDPLTLAGVLVPGLVKVTGWKRATNYDVKVGKGTAGATITLAGKPPAKGQIEFRVWTTAQLRAWDANIRPLLNLVPHPQATATAPTTAAAPTNQVTSGGSADATTGGGSINNPAKSATPAKGSTEDAYAAPAQPKSLTKADALDIYHPILAELEVTAVLPPEELGQWENSESDGGVGYLRRVVEFIEFKTPGGNITTTPQGSTSDGATARGDKYSVGGADANAGTSPTSPSNASGSANDARGATVPPNFGGKP